MAQNTVRVLTEAPKLGRQIRSPSTNFQLRHKPYIIQPTMLHPVLPGETMAQGFLQSATITPPLANGQIGWWMEHHMYYVKHRDLKYRDEFTNMHLDQAYDIAAYFEDGPMPANVNLFYSGSGINWVGLCLECVVDEYFRNEGEDTVFDPVTGVFTGAGIVDGMPICSTAKTDWLDSAKLADQTASDPPQDQLPGWVQPEDDPDQIYPGFEAQYAQWQHMTAVGMVDATFEDYLKSFGMSVPKQLKAELHRPEQLRFIRKWQEPRNTVAGGESARAVLWDFTGADAQRADKDRLFQEPGFILGLCYARPKVYLGGQAGSATELLTDAFRWLPAILQGEAYTSLLEIEPPHPIIPDAGHDTGMTSQSIFIDLRDLFMYGEQFVNFDVGATAGGNLVAHPKANMERRYVNDADITALFPALGSQLLMTEGIWSLQIKSRLRDTSGRGNQGVAGALVV